MKAILCTKYGPPGVLQLREVKKPVPKDNEVLIKIHATTVTSSDCFVRGSKLSPLYFIAMRLALGLRKPRKPILGMVFSGEIESVGKDAGLFKIGDPVFGFDRYDFGAYAQYKCMKEKSIITIKPSNVTYEQAAAVPYGGNLALSFLKESKIQTGQKVLIYGVSGAVGTSAVQLAQYFGADVTGVCSTVNLDLVKSLGASEVIDYTKKDFTETGKQYDIIFDAVGKGKISHFQYQKALAPNGKYISVDKGSPKLDIQDLVLLRELIETGKIKPVIDRCYPLEKIAEAHSYVDKGHKKGNVVIIVE
jgi:NADPH:quinone reductase-like Zn-dependent oxidoreductase